MAELLAWGWGGRWEGSRGKEGKGGNGEEGKFKMSFPEEGGEAGSCSALPF